MAKIVKKIKNFPPIYFIISCLIFLSSKASAQDAADVASTNAIVKEIEKSLIFDKDSRQKIDFYQQQNSKKKSVFTIKEGGDNMAQKSAEVDIYVENPKAQNFDIRQKEKLAYNASLIGQYEVAIELYKNVLAAEPDNNYAKFSLAIIYQKIGQFRQSKTLYNELLKANVDNQDEVIGNLLAILTDESPRDAIYLLSRLSAQNPKSPSIMAHSAIAYDKVKNYDQAILFFKRALELDPDNIDYKYNLAVIYDKTENYEKALDFYLNVAKNYSENNQSVSLDQVQKRIDSIRNKL